MYTPGMLTDVVREVKEAARVREEALLSRVRALVEERSWNINDTNLKLIRDLEEMKVNSNYCLFLFIIVINSLQIQIHQLKNERNDTNTHITKLEEEIKSLRTIFTQVLTTVRPPQFAPMNAFTESPEYLHHTYNNRSKVPAADRPNRHSVNYGTIHNHDDNTTYSNDKGNVYANESATKYLQSNGKQTYASTANLLHENHYGESEPNDGHIVQMEKDTLELRRELQDTIASKKEADNRIYE